MMKVFTLIILLFFVTITSAQIKKADSLAALLKTTNLFNNAFYAVQQKEKTAGENYNLTVQISTFAPPSGGWGATV